MFKKPVLSLLILPALVAGAGAARADVITQWNFNSVVADGSTSTGSSDPSTGSGAALTLGGVTAAFASGAANGGSSDPATSDDTGWQTTGYAAQGLGDGQFGVQFNVSTVGHEAVSFSYDLRHSNTSARHERVQYSIDGLNFVDAAIFSGAAGDTWFNSRSVDLSGIAGVADNASFALRVVAAFAPGSSLYEASSPTGSYAGGTWRFDMVTVSGTPIAPVPEPETWAMMLAGLAALGSVGRRRLFSQG